MLRYSKNYRPPYHNFNELIEFVIKLLNQIEPSLLDDSVICNTPSQSFQLMLQTTDHEDWHTGCGSLRDRPDLIEKDFKYVQPSLRGTVIEDYLNWLDIPVYRTRIMSVKPKTAYSFHCDLTPRIHLPLITNDQCYFMFKDPDEIFHMPADGTTTWTDTRNLHSFMNGSMQTRLHIVCAVDTDYKGNSL